MLKHFYQDIEGWFSNENLYCMILASIDEGTIVECGLWKGKSTAFLGVEIANKYTEDQVDFYVVDHFKGSPNEYGTTHREVFIYGPETIREQFLENTRPISDFYTLIEMDSVDASNLFADGSLDAVILDMGHTYEDVCRDIDAWYPKVKRGGIIAGDDYNAGWPGVVRAVKEKFSIFSQVDNGWYHYKWT